MPSRGQMIATAEAYARSLGWTEVETADMGTAVEMLLGAPGASEQVVAAPLSKLRKALKEWGGPEDYSETEEYDLPENVEAGEAEYDFETAEVEAGEEETCYVEEAENQAELDAALEMAREFPDPEQEWDAATEESEATETEEFYGRMADVLLGEPQYDSGWANRCEQGPSLKQLHRAFEGTETGPDGIPRPEQFIEPVVEPAEEDLMPGGKIVARRGEEVMRFGFAIRPQVKAALEEAGWSFTHVVAAARGDSTVAIEPNGRVTIQNVGGRLIKSAGGLLTVSKGNVSFQVKSISVDYPKAGWQVS